jgi:hypothetical protein
MGPVVHRSLVRLRTPLAFATNSVEKFVRMKTRGWDYGSQRNVSILRVNNVTPKTWCLECGKSFNPA